MASRLAALAKRLRRPPRDRSAEFAIPPSEAPRLSAQASGEMARLFYDHGGRTVHKKLQYLEIYERHFAKYRGTDVRMLEIGVGKGGSLELWRKYFGPDATIFGIDINPDCAGYANPPNQVRIGSQDDPDFLRSVVAEIGAPDIVLDDGSHLGRHQEASFRALFPLLKEGGLYAIEDLNTSYWPEAYEGGYRRRGTGIELVKQIIDDMHGWYHDEAVKTPARDWIKALHVYDSITFIEKGRVTRPGHIEMGG